VSEFFGFDEHVHQVDEPDDTQDKQSGKHGASNFFEPIHTFEIKPVAERPEGAEQEKQDDYVHFFIFFELDTFSIKPHSIRSSSSMAPQKNSIRITITILSSGFFCLKAYEGGAKAHTLDSMC